MEQHGNYLIKPIEKIGGGGFGVVEKIEIYNLHGQLCTDDTGYARKLLSVRRDFIGEIYSLKDWERRFKREVIYQSRCHHENIVPIYFHSLYVEKPWFIMPLAKSSLRNDLNYGILDEYGNKVALSSSQKIDIVRMMLNGVKYMHDKNYIHRDLKPENILRYADGSYKVSDFGLVKNADTSRESDMISNMRAVLGTDGFMSPESQRGLFTKSSDIYSLGVIIDQMSIVGVKRVDELVKNSTHYKPSDRYDSVSDMLEVLDKIQSREKI